MQSTTTFQPGDLVLVAFPFVGSAQSKRRPALVILDTGDDDIVVARVTTQLARTRNATAPQSLSRIEHRRHEVLLSTLQSLLAAMGGSRHDVAPVGPGAEPSTVRK
jgi:mRNA-degrading endonuclease toxin of MazEF toxin-antitoxin module